MYLAWIAGAWIGGIAAAAWLGPEAWPLAVAAAAMSLAFALWRQSRSVAAWGVVLVAVFVGGMLRWEHAQRPVPADDVSHLIGPTEMRLQGVVRDDPDIGETTQRFAIDVRAVRRAGEWADASGGVQVTAPYFPRYEAGDVVQIEGELESPPVLDDFDYAAYLAQRGIHTVTVFPAIEVVGRDDPGLVRGAVLDVRRRLSHALAVSLPEPQASLAQGVLLGERSALPADLKADLNATNTSHLVVVSGANVVLVSAFAAMAFTWLVGKRRALLLSAFAIGAYMLLVGLEPPVVRGTIMGLLLVLAQVSGRRSNGLVAILFAAAVMVGVDPHTIRDVSFQLTFAATAGIVLLSRPIHDWSIEAIAWGTRRVTLPSSLSGLIVMPFATTLAAIIATEPLIAMNFGRVSLVAIPANMLVVPAFGFILGSSLVAALGGLLPFGHALFAAPAHFALSYWITVAEGLASVPAASLTIGGFTSAWAVTTYVTLTAVAFMLLRRFDVRLPHRIEGGMSGRRLAPFAATAVPAGVLVLTAGFVLRPEGEPRLRVTVLDIGQGDAILIETPLGDDVLVDGGPGRAVLRALSEEMSWRDRSIELMVLTHPDADHVNGLLDVFDRYDVNRLATVDDGDAPPWFDDAAVAEGVAIEQVGAGDAFDLGDGLRLDVLWPSGANQDRSLNDSSLVMRLSFGDVSFLLTADIEASAEAALVGSGADLSATVLKVPHHGSSTSSTAEFLAAVGPEVSVISAGEANQFGHPRAEVVDRLDEYGPVLLTADEGSVSFETDGQRLWIER